MIETKHNSKQGVLMEVYLNVYDFVNSNKYLKYIGLDVYHTGVEIGNVQYCYFITDIDPNSTGVISISPEDCGLVLIQKIYMGQAIIDLNNFTKLLQKYQKKYTCGDYNIFSNNCNHFSNEFLHQIVGKGIPKKIFAATNFFKLCCCCLPKKLINGQWALEKLKKQQQQKEQKENNEYIQLNDNID